MAEIIHTHDGGTYELRPCPSWCTVSEHFSPDGAVRVDDGFFHSGPETTVETSHRTANGLESAIRMSIKAWTSRLDADPGPDIIEMQCQDIYLELTPSQARAVSSALAQLADTAAHGQAAEEPEDT